MQTVVDIMKALQGFPPTAPVQVGLVASDGQRMLRDIQAVEVHDTGIVLQVEHQQPDEQFKVPQGGPGEADHKGEAIAVPPPPAVPGGLEGEGEEPEAPRA
jgi:hypothetical protein